MDDYLREFVQESEENITELNNALLQLERTPNDEETTDRVFRMAHTLKGNCGAMGFDDAADLAHAIEDRLEDVRSGRLEVSPELMDSIFAGVDELEAAIDEVRRHGEPQRDPADTIADLRALAPEDELLPATDDEIEAAVAAADVPDPEHAAYHVRLDVEQREGLNTAALVVEALEDAFDLLGTVPPEDDLRAGDHDGRFDAVFGSAVGEAAIEAALDPVNEVQRALITEVTDRASAAAPAADSDDGGDALAAAGGDVDADAAADMEVDELLDEFDEYDDLDALVEEMDDPGDIGEIGDAGSFDDLDIEADDVDAPDPLADAEGGEEIDLESGGGSLGGDEAAAQPEGDAEPAAKADAEDAADADDEEVEDAAETFAELKEEVDPVGFDELQDELDDLEFDQYDQEEEVGFDELLTDEELEGGEFGGMAGAEEEEIDDAIDDILVDDAGVADHESTAEADASDAGAAAPADPSPSDAAEEVAEAEPPGFEDAGEGAPDEIAFGDADADGDEEITFGDDEADAEASAAAEAAPADDAESVDFGEFASGPDADTEAGPDAADATPAADERGDEGTFADEVFPDAGTEAEAEAATADAEADADAEAATESEPAIAPADDPTPAVEPAPEPATPGEAEAAADAEPAAESEPEPEPAIVPGEDSTPAVAPAPESAADAEPSAGSEPAIAPTDGEPTPAVTAAPEPATADAEAEADAAAAPDAEADPEPSITPGDDPTPAVEPVADEPASPAAPEEPVTADDDDDAAAGAGAGAGVAAGGADINVDFGVDDAEFGDEDLDVEFDDQPASPAEAGAAGGDPATADADDDLTAGASDDLAADDLGSEDLTADPDVDLGVDDEVDFGDGEADVEFADAGDAEAADADEAAGGGEFGDFDEADTDLEADFDAEVEEDLDAGFGDDLADASGLDDAAFGDDDEGFDEIRFADADAEAEAGAEADAGTADAASDAPAVDPVEDDVDVDDIAGTGLDEETLGSEAVDDDALDLDRESPLSGFDTDLVDAGGGADAVDAEPVDAGPDYPDRDVDLDELLPTPPGEVAAEGEDDEMASIRVDIDRLDDLMNLVEGLVTQRARLRRAVETGESLATIDQELDEVEELTGELQDTVMDIRLVPLRSTANRLPRVVRDVAREQGKQVEFEMSGADVELDRSVLDDISDPLMHIVRNAVDHGIEHPEDREAADKDPTGTVELRARRQRDTVRIEVEDDGRGLDAEELREKAVAEGMVSEAEAAEMTDQEAYELIFEAGFSTAEEVTDVSGRGVGMDVVANTVADLDGEVEIESEPGAGTTVSLRLPVSVAISEVLFVEAGGEEYGVPLKTVEEIGRMGGVETDDDGEFVTVDDERYPVVRLAERLDAPEPGADAGGMVVRVRTGVRTIALHCDEVRGQQEVVVKPFEDVLGDVPGLTGAAVLGEGEVVNILDVNTL